MDLKFPHHECEIAQSVAHNGHDTVRYWMHNNMITINGQKMGKSLGNFITLDEFFTGSHPLLSQAYSPMTIRFFILQAHYRGTVDFSNEALQGAEKALQRMLEGFKRLQALKPSSEADNVDTAALETKCYEALDDDFNTPVLLAHLFEACSIVNRINDGSLKASQNDIDGLRQLFNTFLVDILGIKVDSAAGETADGGASMKPFEQAVDLLLEMRSEAKARKDWTTSDLIRDRLAAIGFDVKDTKNGFEWSLKN
jgi:cysteinyl-tRNA synthetase